MCGIVGRAGPMTLADEMTFKTMLLLDYFRGTDSTGMATVRASSGEVNVLKVADDPIIFMQHSEFESVLNGNLDAIWIGHNRASTIGASTRANAHPFMCEHITGVHNGTLEKSSMAALAARLPEVYGTDSETIFTHIAVYGIEETVKLLQGAWALVWYDSIEKTLNMLRNDQRPLFTCEIERGDKGNVLTWASDWKMIYAARVMAEDKGELIEDREGFAYFPLPTDVLHTWSMEKILQGEVHRPVKKAMKGMALPPKVVTSNVGFKTNGSPATIPEVKDTVKISELTVTEEYAGHVFGGRMTIEEWNDIAAYGCSYCAADVHHEDEKLLIFQREGVVLCGACSGEKVTTLSTSISAAGTAVTCG